MAVHKVERLVTNASNPLMTYLFYDLFVSALLPVSVSPYHL